MAFMIKLIRASTLDDLECAINDFFAESVEDVRNEVALAGGVTYAKDEYVAPVSISAPHKRRFGEEED